MSWLKRSSGCLGVVGRLLDLFALFALFDVGFVHTSDSGAAGVR